MNKISTRKKKALAAKLFVLSLVVCNLSLNIACSDFLYDDSDIVTYSDKEFLNSDADTLWSVLSHLMPMPTCATFRSSPLAATTNIIHLPTIMPSSTTAITSSPMPTQR